MLSQAISPLLAVVAGPRFKGYGFLERLLQARPTSEALLDATRKCFMAGQLSGAVPLLMRFRRSAIAWQVVAEAIRGDLLPRPEAVELLMRPYRRTGSTLLHHSKWLLVGDGNPESFGALLDFLQGDGDNLDGLMTTNYNGHHPLYLAMLHKTTSDKALQLMHRVSPEYLWRTVPCFDGGKSTALHAACSHSHFSEEQRKNLLSRVPSDVLASSLGPYGRTPLLHAAACRVDTWVDCLLDHLPQDALAVSDDHGCTLLHLMCYLPFSVQERIVQLVPEMERLCSQTATIHSQTSGTLRKGNAAVCCMARDGGLFATKLVSSTSDESLFSCEWLIGENAQVRCSLLHMSAGRADEKLCAIILERIHAKYRSALTLKDSFGQTPLHILFEIPGGKTSPAYVYGREHLNSCALRVLTIASLFLSMLSDEELQIKGAHDRTVLAQLLLMMIELPVTEATPGLFAICEELVDRTPSELWHGSGQFLSSAFQIPVRPSLGCAGKLRFVAKLLDRASNDDFYHSSSMYNDVMRTHPDLEAARLLLDVTPPDVFTHFRHEFVLLCFMLAKEVQESFSSQEMVELLLEYLPRSMLLQGSTRGGTRVPSPIEAAFFSGSVRTVEAIIAACPEARTTHLLVGEKKLTPLEYAERYGFEDITALLQPPVKNAACT